MNDSEKLAYFAGIVDGEGSIMYVRYAYDKRKPDNIYYRVVLRIANNDPVIIKWIQTNFPSKWSLEHKTHRGPNTDDSYILNLFYKDAVRMLERLMPYLLLKKKQAQVAKLAHYYHSLQHGRCKTSFPIQQIKNKLHMIMKGLNYRGKDATIIRQQWGELLETLPSNVGGNQQPSRENDIKVSRKVQRLTVEESTNKTDTSAPHESYS